MDSKCIAADKRKTPGLSDIDMLAFKEENQLSQRGDIPVFTDSNESAVRIAMHGRILRCPMGGNPDDCPLHEIRLLPLDERLKWLDSKTDFELIQLFSDHIKCLNEKTASLADTPTPA